MKSILVGLSLLVPWQAFAIGPDAVQVVVAGESIQADKDLDFNQSLASRVLATIAGRLGYSQPFELMPFARAVTACRAKDNVVIAPLARTPKRDAQYRWLVSMKLSPAFLQDSGFDFRGKNYIRDRRTHFRGEHQDGPPFIAPTVSTWRGRQRCRWAHSSKESSKRTICGKLNSLLYAGRITDGLPSGMSVTRGAPLYAAVFCRR